MTSIPNPDNDQDNADLLVDLYQDEIRYCTDSKTWFVWQDNKWIMDPEASLVTNYWTVIARQLPRAIDTPNGPRPNTHRKYSLSSKGQDAAVKTAKRNSLIQIKQCNFDSLAYELNTPDGIVDLRTATLNPPAPASFHTKETSVSPSNKSKPRKWLAFLKEIFKNDQETIDYMQRLMGLATIGEVIEQIMPFAVGPGGTGKSTFFGVIEDVMGNYAQPARPSLLMRSQNSHPEELAKLQGLRMIFMSELNEGERFDESRLKLLTGNDSIEGRHMYKSSFSYKPNHTLFLFGNTKPRITEGGSALWRRLKVIPFEQQKFNKLDKTLRQTLVTHEGPEILNWLIEGARLYLEQNILLDAQVIQTVTKQYENEEDTLGQFLDECCLVADNAETPYKTFRERYVLWCEDNGYRPLSTRTLTEKLTNNPKYGNISSGKLNRNTRGLFGIAINEPSRMPL